MVRLVTVIVTTCLAFTAMVPSPVAIAQSGAPGRCEAPGIIMMATSWCSYCRKARNFFRENNIEFDEIDVERTESASVRTAAKTFGVPYIIVGGDEVRGFNERRLRELLCLPG